MDLPWDHCDSNIQTNTGNCDFYQAVYSNSSFIMHQIWTDMSNKYFPCTILIITYNKFSPWWLGEETTSVPNSPLCQQHYYDADSNEGPMWESYQHHYWPVQCLCQGVSSVHFKCYVRVSSIIGWRTTDKRIKHQLLNSDSFSNHFHGV